MRRLKFALLALIPFISKTFSAVMPASHDIQTKKTQSTLTPKDAILKLELGNKRFFENQIRNRNYIQQAKLTAIQGQAPFAVILSCMDSRGSIEIIFDLSIGDVFSLRVAGNILNDDILGSLEFATKVSGAKAILVLGHTQCGAVEAACQGQHLGHISDIVNKINPAVAKVREKTSFQTCTPDILNAIVKQNILNTIRQIPDQSPIIFDLIQHTKIVIVGGIHELDTGRVLFFDSEGQRFENV